MSRYYYDERHKPKNWRHSLPLFLLLIISLSANIAGLAWIKKYPSPVFKPTSSKTEDISKILSIQGVVDANIQPKKIIQTQTNALYANGTTNANSLLELTNIERAKFGLAALVHNALLDSSAMAKCQNMVADDYWSHIDLQGREPWHFIDEAGYRKSAAGENLAYGFASSEFVIQGWMNSPEHRKAILDTNYQDVGFGICSSPNYVQTGPQSIVVQHFGKQLP